MHHWFEQKVEESKLTIIEQNENHYILKSVSDSIIDKAHKDLNGCLFFRHQDNNRNPYFRFHDGIYVYDVY